MIEAFGAYKKESSTQAIRQRLELLNVVHQQVHRLESLEYLKNVLKAETEDVLRKNLKLLESAHKTVHRLWHSELSKIGLESTGRLKVKQLWKLDSDYLVGDFGSLRCELNRRFRFSNKERRESLIQEIIQGASDHARYVREHVRERVQELPSLAPWGDLLPQYLLGLYNRFNDKPVIDCFEPYKDEHGFVELHDFLASRILKKIEGEKQKERHQENKDVKPLFEQLLELDPPLTWEEILFYYMEDVSSARRVAWFFPAAERYCLECDNRFPLSKNNPGYFRCPTCSARIRQRRKRQRERNTLGNA